VKEWDLDPDRFKLYFQNVLFKKNYNVKVPNVKEFNIGDLDIPKYFTPDSSEYKALIELYNWKADDIKTYLGTSNSTKVGAITELLNKKLIFPYISVKNCELDNKVLIILPDIKPDIIQKLIKIFSFFNYGFLYEIEGQYFIHGIDDIIKFESGLMIKLYLPDCQFGEFTKLFYLLFQYLDIKHYIIHTNLINGDELLKSTLGNLNFLEQYNPLKNLIWNEKDKKWMNHKLFTKKNEKIYPKLVSS